MSLPDLFLTLIVNFAWGFSFIAGKIGAAQFQPLFFTALRFSFLLILMLPWLKPARGYMFPLLRVAFLLGAVHFSMVFLGIHASGNIASVAIATQLYVPFSAILATLFLREKITFIRLLAIAIALAGVMVIGFDPVVFYHLDAIFWVTGAAFIVAVATILMRQCPNLGVFRLQAWIALVATPSLFLLSLIFEKDHTLILSNTPLAGYWTPLYSAVAASIIGHGSLYYLVGRYRVSVVTPLLLLAPVLAAVFGIFFFGDKIGWRLIIGGSMTLLGIMCVSLLQEPDKNLN